jgi:hypothetical protein
MKNWDKIGEILKNESVYLVSSLHDKAFRSEPKLTEPTWYAKSSKEDEYPISAKSKIVIDAIMEWNRIDKNGYNDY